MDYISPSQHLDWAQPKLLWFTPTLPTCPTVAKQFLELKKKKPYVGKTSTLLRLDHSYTLVS